MIMATSRLLYWAGFIPNGQGQGHLGKPWQASRNVFGEALSGVFRIHNPAYSKHMAGMLFVPLAPLNLLYDLA